MCSGVTVANTWDAEEAAAGLGKDKTHIFWLLPCRNSPKCRELTATLLLGFVILLFTPLTNITCSVVSPPSSLNQRWRWRWQRARVLIAAAWGNAPADFLPASSCGGGMSPLEGHTWNLPCKKLLLAQEVEKSFQNAKQHLTARQDSHGVS